jgi:lycopene cyclase domain-containing protein
MINIGIIIIPLLLSFESNLKYYKKLPQVLFAAIVVGIPFIIWDSFSTSNNVWNFSIDYVDTIRIFHLPIEEILFFITVPYSILFLYETYLFYTKEDSKTFLVYPIIVTSLISLLTALIFYEKNYTFTILIIFTLVQLTFYFKRPKFIFRKKFIFFMLITFVPFGIVNYFLTTIPIVNYNHEEILGIRIITIPLEDFVYSFTLISSYLYFYEMAKR